MQICSGIPKTGAESFLKYFCFQAFICVSCQWWLSKLCFCLSPVIKFQNCNLDGWVISPERTITRFHPKILEWWLKKNGRRLKYYSILLKLSYVYWWCGRRLLIFTIYVIKLLHYMYFSSEVKVMELLYL